MSAISVSRPAVSDHGGNLSAARARFPGAPEPWIDLSTGINPRAYPVPALAPELWRRLPDDATLECLAAAAARAYGLPSSDQVCLAPGSQALIQALPRLRPPGRVAVLGPTYAEHAAGWAGAGHEVTEVGDMAALSGDAWDVGVVVNPNNPDGRQLPPDLLMETAARLAGRDGWLVVDEAFADVVPEIALAARASAPGLVVLRSFGKFFGLAGLRLGFALTEPSLAARVRAALGPWPVSGPAVAIATKALADTGWMDATRRHLALEAARLDRLLNDRGLTVLGGTPLFRLAETADAAAVFDRLGAAGILVRRFDAHPRWLRFGPPPDEPAWTRLVEALA